MSEHPALPPLIDAVDLLRWMEEGRDLVVLDASSHPLNPERDAAAEFRAGHIAGAQYLDLASLSDPQAALPGMAGSAAQVEARLRALGVGAATDIVLYDHVQYHTAARAWWLLRLRGIDRVSILDGGLAAWIAAGGAVEQGETDPVPLGDSATSDNPALLRDLAQMRGVVADGSEQVVDARGAARFNGSDPDPRAGVAPGHMPGAVNLRYDRLLTADGRWRQPEEIEAAFVDAGVDLDRPIAVTCGSGVTAAVLMFGLHLIGRDRVALYDGSWSEWGALSDTPKVTA